MKDDMNFSELLQDAINNSENTKTDTLTNKNRFVIEIDNEDKIKILKLCVKKYNLGALKNE